MSIPPTPDVPSAQRATGSIHLRYEDVCQDGRIVATALPQALGEAVWRPLLSRSSTALALRAAGIVPILARLHVEGGDGPLSVQAPLEVDGLYQMAHSAGPGGEVERLLLRMWTTIRGPKGRTHGPPPAGAGNPLEVGRVYAEHVLTRPFAPPDQRKVRRLELPDVPAVPEACVAWTEPDTLLVLPEGATALDDVPVLDEVPLVFGLDDTDSNQHVNSLVYPRLFREAALRRLVARGRDAALLVREVVLGYRKPCFAGERYQVRARAFELGAQVGITAVLVPHGAPAEVRPHCFARVLLAG